MELKFDTMAVNMKLAEDFLTTHKANLEKIQSFENVEMDLEKFTNMSLEVQDFDDTNLQLETLATKVQENAELIAQLEVLKRGKVKEDVLNYDLKLIVDYLKYWSSKETSMIRPTLISKTLYTFQKKDYPLSFLGYVAENIKLAEEIIILCNKATLPVIYMFAILFRQVGLKSVTFKYSDKDDNTAGKVPFNEWNGCTAVVGEHADVDSAVDALIASTSHDPWRLHRIYVQESVYKTLKNALSWKCRPKNSLETGDSKSNELLDITHLEYGRNKFIFDYPEFLPKTIEKDGITTSIEFVQSYQLVNEGTQTIFVEAYRTVKELLSLLQKNNSFCLSLWSSDVSESNEIAFNVETPLIWVNDFGALDGPAHVSQAFYTNFNHGLDLKCNDKVEKLRNNWTKLSTEERVRIITNALQNFQSEYNNEEKRATAQKIIEGLRHMPNNKSFENTKGKMWINMTMANGVILINDPFHNFPDIENFKSAARGNVLLLYGDIGGDTVMYDYLCNVNLPFIMRQKFDSSENSVFILEKAYLRDYRNRMIVINYGTIFAN